MLDNSCNKQNIHYSIKKTNNLHYYKNLSDFQSNWYECVEEKVIQVTYSLFFIHQKYILVHSSLHKHNDCTEV